MGRSIREPWRAAPASVLIGQLRDHLAAGSRPGGPGPGDSGAAACPWPGIRCSPFSRRYFPDRAGPGRRWPVLFFLPQWREVRRGRHRRSDAEAPLPPRLNWRAHWGCERWRVLANPVNAFFSSGSGALISEKRRAIDRQRRKSLFKLDVLDNWKLQFGLTERMKRWVERDWDAPRACRRSCRPGRATTAAKSPHAGGIRPAGSPRAIAATAAPRPCSGATAREIGRPGRGGGRAAAGGCAIAIRRAGAGGLARRLASRRFRRRPGAALQLLRACSSSEGRGFKWHSLVRHWFAALSPPATSRPAGEQRAGEPDRHPGDSAVAERARRRVPRPV
ncbi:hypothetical protein ACPA9J_28055 [Pseudomonas aeruginosa]